MAFLQFPNQQYFLVVETGENRRLGYYNLQDGTELKHMMVTIFQRGLIVTPYTVRLNFYGNDSLDSPIFSSDYVTLSTSTLAIDDIGTPYTNNWLGNIYFDFSGYPLNPDINYYVSVETSGYTRVGDTFYLGINLDWYSPVNNSLSATQTGARVRILGKR